MAAVSGVTTQRSLEPFYLENRNGGNCLFSNPPCKAPARDSQEKADDLEPGQPERTAAPPAHVRT